MHNVMAANRRAKKKFLIPFKVSSTMIHNIATPLQMLKDSIHKRKSLHLNLKNSLTSASGLNIHALDSEFDVQSNFRPMKVLSENDLLNCSEMDFFCKNENSIVFIKRWKTKNLKKLKQIQKEKKH